MLDEKRELVRSVKMSAAWDRTDADPKLNYGVNGVDIHFILRGPEGCVVFLLMTNWMLPHVYEQYKTQGLNFYLAPIPAYLTFHSLVPRSKADRKHIDSCWYLDGKPAFCGKIGDSFAPDKVYAALVAEGDEGVWMLLETRYAEVFESTEERE